MDLDSSTCIPYTILLFKCGTEELGAHVLLLPVHSLLLVLYYCLCFFALLYTFSFSNVVSAPQTRRTGVDDRDAGYHYYFLPFCVWACFYSGIGTGPLYVCTHVCILLLLLRNRGL